MIIDDLSHGCAITHHGVHFWPMGPHPAKCFFLPPPSPPLPCNGGKK